MVIVVVIVMCLSELEFLAMLEAFAHAGSQSVNQPN